MKLIDFKIKLTLLKFYFVQDKQFMKIKPILNFLKIKCKAKIK